MSPPFAHSHRFLYPFCPLCLSAFPSFSFLISCSLCHASQNERSEEREPFEDPSFLDIAPISLSPSLVLPYPLGADQPTNDRVMHKLAIWVSILCWHHFLLSSVFPVKQPLSGQRRPEHNLIGNDACIMNTLGFYLSEVTFD